MAEIRLDINARDNATPAIDSILDAFRSGVREIEKTRRIDLDERPALAAIGSVKRAIESIPDVTYKDMVVRVKTQASPIRPFSEGMDYVEGRLRALPSGTEHTIRVRGHDAWSVQGTGPARPDSYNFSPTVNLSVSGGGASGSGLARDIDRELASLWRTNRSELRRAVTT